MTRLIDADVLIKDAFDLMDRNELLEDVPQIIEDYCDAQPTVDAVPVIRCKDCKWYYRGGATCMFWDGANGMCGEDYCSYAERKDNDCKVQRQ